MRAVSVSFEREFLLGSNGRTCPEKDGVHVPGVVWWTGVRVLIAVAGRGYSESWWEENWK